MSKWNDLINRYNPDEDDLCDLLDEAEKIGRANAYEKVMDAIQERYDSNPKRFDELPFTNVIDVIEKLKEQE